MRIQAEQVLMHYGMPRRSGRYPWGSGDNPYQHSGDFLSRYDELKKSGIKESEIARQMGFVDEKTGRVQTTKLRAQVSLANDIRRGDLVARAKSLREDGLSLNEIAKEMGYKNDSSVRSLLNENSAARTNQAKATADFLKEQIDSRGMIDVGAGVERELGVSKEKLNEALYMLEMEGYPTYGGRVAQATNPGKMTTLRVICPPGTEHKDIYQYDKINSVKDYTSHDDGQTFDPKYVYPKSMDSKRLQIRYAEDGGEAKDGVIELRRGVDDLSLGESHYAQVRILVDGTHYLKGMAVYSDDLPDGVDVRFNTNKKKGTPMTDVLKKIKNDPDNPFGSLIKEGINDPDDPTEGGRGGQSYYYDKNGKKQLSLINKRAEEGDWGEWSNKLSSQFLSKQSLQLIEKQLNLAAADKLEEFDEINSLTNPTVKKRLLQSFADDCDAAAVHLQAAALPRQRYQVILPLTSIKDNEVYAPNYKDGETVALIRYPHGGTFEIPILKVNNKSKEGKSVLGTNPADAIGINKKVADRLSGADFDGDTVMVIPCNSSTSRVRISSSPLLKGLEGFDPKMEYGTVEKDGKYYDANGKAVKIMRNTQTEMGIVSNLITDMTLKGAKEEELARAVRHSMVVIDAEKHKLNYQRSAEENGIAALKKKYQKHENDDGYGGSSTLISRASSQVSIPKRKGSPRIDPKTGELIWKTDTSTYTDKKGNVKTRRQQSTKMAEAKDARELSSGTPQEEAYARYANTMKSLANEARLSILSAGKIAYNPSAKKTYAEEVATLESKLNIALKNAPRERQAQVIANSVVDAKKKDNPDMTKAEVKKASQQALTRARVSVGAQRTPVNITDKEWEAIQAGAISENKLAQILNNTDIDRIRELATPRTRNTVSQGKVNRIKALSASGYTTAEIAEAVGLSTSAVRNYLN